MIDVDIGDWPVECDWSREHAVELVRAVCIRFGRSRGAVSLALLGDDDMIALNRRYFDLDRTTDCFSFDLSEPDQAAFSFEILVNHELARRQAAQRGHSLAAELALYVVHGLLHQMGFDDLEEEQARCMHRQEDEILECLGYGTVYNNGSTDADSSQSAGGTGCS